MPTRTVGSTRPTRAIIDLAALSANYEAIDSATGDASMLPVLKANAYGHGLIEVASHLEPHRPYGFGVAILDEALTLRSAGISTPILVLGAVERSRIDDYLDHDLMLTATGPDDVRRIDAAAADRDATAQVHLKFDTGMGRIGARHDAPQAMLDALAGSSRVEVAGTFSHFATADEAARHSTADQLERFLDLTDKFDAGLRHIANSGGVLQHPESHLDLVRPGIMLYGVHPSDEVERTIPIRPAMTWRSAVSFVKTCRPGDQVSYGSTWSPTTATTVATVPAGYGDGYMRALSNRGEVVVGGRRAPIVGRVCMDQFMVDVGPDAGVEVGAEVSLMDKDLDAAQLARWAGTIPYEVLTNVAARVPRLYV